MTKGVEIDCSILRGKSDAFLQDVQVYRKPDRRLAVGVMHCWASTAQVDTQIWHRVQFMGQKERLPF